MESGSITEALAQVDKWPHWPFLPVVNRQIGHVGVIIEMGVSGQFQFAQDVNLFDSAASLLDAKDFKAEELESAGWEVD